MQLHRNIRESGRACSMAVIKKQVADPVCFESKAQAAQPCGVLANQCSGEGLYLKDGDLGCRPTAHCT
jgi:hypothetical protein